MIGKRILAIAAVLSIATLTGCGDGSDQTIETTESEIITQPGTETVEVEIPTTDSLLVERTVETEIDVDVDTTVID